MARLELKHVNSFRDRHGRLRHYFRRPGHSAIPLPGHAGSTEFMGAYADALAATVAPLDLIHAVYNGVRADTAAPRKRSESIYFVKIGKAIKIGFTTDLNQRLKTFRGASAEPVRLLGVFPGNRKLETELHRLFAPSRITNEFFASDFVIREFLSIAKRDSVTAAVQWARGHNR